MHGYPRPWFVSGGWAVDLFVGRLTREHHDVEIGAFHSDQDALRRHLARWNFSRIRSGAWRPWAVGERIDLPEFQLQAMSDEVEPLVFDIFLNPLDGSD